MFGYDNFVFKNQFFYTWSATILAPGLKEKVHLSYLFKRKQRFRFGHLTSAFPSAIFFLFLMSLQRRLQTNTACTPHVPDIFKGRCRFAVSYK